MDLDSALVEFLKCEVLHHLASDTVVILHVSDLYWGEKKNKQQQQNHQKKKLQFSVVSYQTKSTK